MVSKVKSSMSVGLALAVALALIVAPLMMVQKVHAYAPVQAPDFYMTDLENNTFSLGSLQGKVVLLEFFSPSCLDCIESMSQVQIVRAHFGSGLAVISDDSDYIVTYSDLVAFNNTYDLNWTLTLDYVHAMSNSSMYNQNSTNGGCGGTPQFYIINQTGYIIFAYCGYTDASVLINDINTLIQWDLYVTSAHGSPSPGVGDNFYNDSTVVTCNVTSPVIEGLTTWICMGYNGTGSVPVGASNPNATNNPASGSSNMSVTFTITQNSSITWNWSHFLNVTVGTAYQMWTNGSFPDLVFLDVRNYNEAPSQGAPGGYGNGHVPGAIWIPWLGIPTVNQLNLSTRIGELASLRNNDIILYCKGGVRSFAAAAFLVSQGFTKVYNMYQALPGWYNAGYPVVTSRLYAVHVGVTNNMFWGSVDLNATSPNPSFLGWNMLPGMTTLSVATTVSNGTLYIVHVGVNNDMFWGRVNLTDSTFSGWTMLPGKTNLTPSIAVSNGKLYIVHVGLTSNMFWGFVNLNNSTFSGWTTLPGMTGLSVATSVSNGKLYVVHVGLTSSMFWGSVNLASSTFSGWNLLPGVTNLSPSIAAYDGELYLAHVGFTNNMFWGRLNLTDSSFSGWNVLPGLTTKSVSITYWGELYILHVGVTSNMFWGGVDPSSSFSGWTTLPGMTSLSVAAIAADPTS